MNKRIALFLALLASASMTAHGQLFRLDFNAVNGGSGGSASGVWVNESTGGVVGFAPTLSVDAGGSVRPADAPENPSDIDEGFPFLDIPSFLAPPSGVDLFNPNFSGDIINVEVAGGATSVVTINFDAVVTDPILLFSDVDTQSILDFGSTSFTVTGGAPNLVHSGNTIGSNGANVAILEEETAGSLMFSGDFTSLSFSMVNSGLSPTEDDDRTGFEVVSMSQPAAIPEPSTWALIGLGALLMVCSRRFRHA